MQNQKTAQFRKSSASAELKSAELKSNSILSSDKGHLSHYEKVNAAALQSTAEKGKQISTGGEQQHGLKLQLRVPPQLTLSQTPSVMQIEKQQNDGHVSSSNYCE